MGHKTKKLGIAVLTGLICILSYQNCAQQKLQRPGGGDDGGDVIISSTENVSKVTYDPQLEMAPPTVAPLLKVDLQSGEASVRASDGSVKTCAIDNARLSEINSILANGKICKPAPAPADTAVCMAIGIADVKLEAGAEQEMLRPVVCNSGQYLCDGQDPIFRQLLESLVSSPPIGCQ